MGSSKPPKIAMSMGTMMIIQLARRSCMDKQTPRLLHARTQTFTLSPILTSIHNISQYNHTTLNQKEPCNCRIT